jgi:hypothetical protein
MGRDEQGVHQRERQGHDPHERPNLNVAFPQQGQQHQAGEQGAVASDLHRQRVAARFERFQARFVYAEESVLREHLGEGAAGAPQNRRHENAKPALGYRRNLFLARRFHDFS